MLSGRAKDLGSAAGRLPLLQVPVIWGGSDLVETLFRCHPLSVWRPGLLFLFSELI
jgi:hypothetical protein